MCEGNYVAEKTRRHEIAATAINDSVDPMHTETKIYYLVHREDVSNCQKVSKDEKNAWGPSPMQMLPLSNQLESENSQTIRQGNNNGK